METDYIASPHYRQAMEIAKAYTNAERSRMIDGIDGEDIRTAAYLGALRAIRTFDTSKGCLFPTHCVNCVKGEIGQEYRRQDYLTRYIRAEIREMEPSEIPAHYLAPVEYLPKRHKRRQSHANIEELALRNIQRQLVCELIMELSELERKAVFMFFWEDATHAQVAAACGRSEAWSLKLIYHRRERLQRACMVRGITR